LLETAVALALGHLCADFLLQSDRLVREKHRPQMLALHVAIVAGASWAALGFALQPLLILLIAVSHYAIDWAKLRFGGPGFAPFALDQAGHAAMIALGAALFPGAYAAGLWALESPPAFAAALVRLPEAQALAAGLVATVWAGGYAVKALMTGLKLPSDTGADLPLGGQLIGRLERMMILMLLLADQPDAIGLLIAAKSILRFNELARDADRRSSEYVIIGTLASFAWAIGAAWMTASALDALAP
jgi:hypothetical protein